MSSSDRSMVVWAVYAATVGASLAIAPNFVLSTLGVMETDEPWIRILGVTVMVLALYYADALRNKTRNLYVASILGRGFVAAALIVLVLTGEPWQLLLFAAAEILGLTWTYLALRSEAS